MRFLIDAQLFMAKTPDYVGCICLDFLGFSRLNRDLSTGYTAQSVEVFFHRLRRASVAPKGAPRFYQKQAQGGS
jgi:hypothetical protein